MLKKRRTKKKDESKSVFDRSSSTLKTDTPQRRVSSTRVKIDRQPTQEFKGVDTSIFDLKMKLAKQYFSGNKQQAPVSFIEGSKFEKPSLFEIGSKVKQAFDIATRTRQGDMFIGRSREPQEERPMEIKVAGSDEPVPSALDRFRAEDDEFDEDDDEGKHDDIPEDTMDNFKPPVSVNDDELFLDDNGNMPDQFDEQFTNLPDGRKIQVDVTDVVDSQEQESFPFFPQIEPPQAPPEQQFMQD